MKRKIANRPDWARLIRKRYVQQYVADESFEGHLSLLFLDEVREPLQVTYGEREVCIAGNGHVWILFFPNRGRYSVTVMLNERNEVVQWYFDIVNSIQLNDEGVPVIEDLYLDLVVLPTGETYSLDEDELAAALDEGVIDRETYELAETEMDKLKHSVVQGENVFINEIETYVELVCKYR